MCIQNNKRSCKGLLFVCLFIFLCLDWFYSHLFTLHCLDPFLTCALIRYCLKQALIAKQSHFAYSTPRKGVMLSSVENFGDSDDVKAPNAPKQSRVSRFRWSAKKLADISVALFASDTEAVWPKRDLFMEVEDEI